MSVIVTNQPSLWVFMHSFKGLDSYKGLDMSAFDISVVDGEGFEFVHGDSE